MDSPFSLPSTTSQNNFTTIPVKDQNGIQICKGIPS